jgi:hypothetical protein
VIRQKAEPDAAEVVKTLERLRLFLGDLISRMNDGPASREELLQDAEQLLGKIDQALDGTGEKPARVAPDSFY